jgi:hypothetical protein
MPTADGYAITPPILLKSRLRSHKCWNSAMYAKGFGQSRNLEIEKSASRVVCYCRQRRPEALDKIFDSLPVNRTTQEYKRVSQQVLAAALAQLQGDIDTLGWFCGYFAGEINRTEDNHRPRHSIAELSKLLITSGMELFTDFAPYPGCRIVILNPDKFESLPEEIQAIVQQAFDVTEQSGEEAQQINDALLQELTVTQK